MHASKTVSLSIVVLLFVAACGQKGPLYLPAEEQAPAENRDARTEEQKKNEDNGGNEENS